MNDPDPRLYPGQSYLKRQKKDLEEYAIEESTQQRVDN